MSDVEIISNETSIQIIASSPGTSVKPSAGSLDGYFGGLQGLPMSGVLGITEDLALTGLEPATQYNLTFFGFTNDCGGVNGSKIAVISNICTGKTE